MIKNKKGMIQQLTAIGFGIIGLAVLVGIGLTVLTKLTASVGCGSATYNVSTALCNNATGFGVDALNTAGTGIKYSMTQLGSSGLLGWLPAIIALLIGVFFLTYFMGRKKGY